MRPDERLLALRAAGLLRAVDVGFATTMCRLAAGTPWEVTLAAALASRAVGDGDVCLDLRAVAGTRPEGAPETAPHPAFERWAEALAASRLVAGGEGDTPLVLDAGRLYLRRYWEHERTVVAAVVERCRDDSLLADEVLHDRIERLFPRDAVGPDDQRLAAMVAARKRFCVVTGGPGTGKTTAVVRILAILAEGLAARLGRKPDVLVLAPTGKAAARLNESLARERGKLAVDDAIRAAIPPAAATIHRALGAFGEGSGRFRHDAENPLAADVVVVDEASMVPLALMSRLVSALRPAARLVLLGDRDQLASVEAGSVLGDLCDRGAAIAPSRALAEAALRIAGETLEGAVPEPRGRGGIGDAIVVLRRSRRFDPDEGIGALAAAVNRGDAKTALAILAAGGAVERVEPPARGLAPELEKRMRKAWTGYARGAGAETLVAFDAFRVLCALREGPEGVTELNRTIEGELDDAGIVASRPGHYPGRPVLVTRNDYEVRLFNGDVGIVAARGEGGRFAAVFLGPDGSPRSVPVSLLPAHETAFALTVHKSQGSEFGSVAVVLPRKESPVATRELLYTAVTRARETVIVQATQEAVERAIATRTPRSSGLRDALWGASPPPEPPRSAAGRQLSLL